MNASLPPGWTTCKIGQVLEFKYGKALPASIRDGAGFPVFGSNGVVGHHSSWLASAPTIVIGRKGSVGEVCFSSENCSPIDTTYYVDEFDAFNPKFCFYLLKCLDLGSLNKATAIPGLNRRDAYGLQLSLPPLAEQTRIAAKLDELLAQVDTLKARIDGIPALLKRFRQSVLAAAVSGQLTGKWRGNSSVSDNWRTLKFSSLIKKLRAGSAERPCDHDAGVPIIRSSAVRSMALDYSDVRYLSEGADLRNEDFLHVGDLLFTRLSGSAEFVGVCALVSNALATPTQYPDRVFCARLDDPQFASYLEIFFASDKYLSYIRRSLKSSAGHQRITMDTIRDAEVVVPPLEEQTEIVRRVEQLFAFADQLEARVAAAQERIDKLTQSILAKAFRGELVPQDPNDEPASVLLERIKAQRAAAPKAKRGRKAKA